MIGIGLGIGASRGRPAPAAFTMNAGNFPGTLAMIRQTVTPVADSTAFTFVAWVKPLTTESTARELLHFQRSSGAERGYFMLNATNKFAVKVNAADGTALILTATTTTVTIAGGWKCLMASGDQATNKVLLYINDTEEVNAAWTSVAQPINYNTNGFYRYGIGGTYSGASLATMDVGNLAFHHSVGLDFTQQSVRRKFIDGSGKPVDLGSDGSTPFGSQPLIYMGNPGTYADWDAGTNLNLGSLDSGAAWSKAGSGSITSATPP